MKRALVFGLLCLFLAAPAEAGVFKKVKKGVGRVVRAVAGCCRR